MTQQRPNIEIKVTGPGAKEMRQKMEKHALNELDAFGKPDEAKAKGQRLAVAMKKNAAPDRS